MATGQENTGNPQKSTISLITNPNVQIKPTIATFRSMIEEAYKDKNTGKSILRLNEMTGRPEIYDKSEWRQWTDADESLLKSYFQTKYGMYSPKMLEDAIAIHFNSHRVNPLTDLLKSIKWDGTNRIEGFLTFATHCDDNDYTREVSRLIFAGGVNRAFRPGCKFDDMVVLVGKQGNGKTALVRWLNMEDQYYKEIKTISGKEGVEALRGCWVGEFSELMAMTKIKEMETVKAYITSQEDTYRAPYKKYVETIPRRCIFIGTTNNFQFLTDKTGNRRFYPVQCNFDGYDVFNNEKAIREYIRQCWGEAVHRYKENNLPPYARRDLIKQIREAQNDAEEDDWRVGAIMSYLEQKEENDTVSVIELWYNALDEPIDRKPTRSDSIDIAKIINQIPGWLRCKTPKRVKWGLQKVWQKQPEGMPW